MLFWLFPLLFGVKGQLSFMLVVVVCQVQSLPSMSSLFASACRSTGLWEFGCRLQTEQGYCVVGPGLGCTSPERSRGRQLGTQRARCGLVMVKMGQSSRNRLAHLEKPSEAGLD